MPSKSLSDDMSNDICPICKSNRYLNPSLQFLINPECYHKMCSTCVDRIFTSGPAPCPVPHCARTLRKKGFHAAFFGDLKVEREVDIRRRVNEVFNRREDEFETLLDWNNYLQEVEDLVFDLVEGKGKVKADAEEKLRVYREGNKGDIEGRREASQREREMGKRKEKEEKERVRERRLAIVKEEAREKEELEAEKRNVLDKLASGEGDALEITRQAQKVILKKSSGRRGLGGERERDPAFGAGNGSDSGLTIRGLKKKIAPEEEKPYDPFGGIDLTPSRYTVQDEYDNQWLGNAKNDPRHMAGGYSLQEYYARTMFEAFSGLGVFIEDEVVDRVKPESPSTGTMAAVQASTSKMKLESKMEVDDVF
ncbi:cdk-activating kinase assembly factor mat1 protein [Rutstroemia sp. NJR-2017a BVV2]|nr:cdk-activating kinase assembly factor mat1 protein [Rutstroemia sp. NJR-2017a BVV2]